MYGPTNFIKCYPEAAKKVPTDRDFKAKEIGLRGGELTKLSLEGIFVRVGKRSPKGNLWRVSESLRAALTGTKRKQTRRSYDEMYDLCEM